MCCVLCVLLSAYPALSTRPVVDPPAIIYMGEDKVENEKLIAYGLPEDLW